MFEPFQNFIPKAAQKQGISTESKAAHVCHIFRKLIPEIFNQNEFALQNIQPGYFKKQVLVINVSNPAWAQEVIMRKERIITEINGKFSEEVIKNLRTQIQTNPMLFPT